MSRAPRPRATLLLTTLYTYSLRSLSTLTLYTHSLHLLSTLTLYTYSLLVHSLSTLTLYTYSLHLSLYLLSTLTRLYLLWQNFGWPLSLMLASFTVVVVGTSLSVAMVRGGMVTGFRAIFVSFLSVLQAARSAQGCGLWCMRLQPLVQGCDLHYMHIPHALHPPLRPAQLNLVLNAVVTVELYLLWLYLPWQMNLVLNAIVTFELPAQLTLIVNAGELGVYLPWPYSLLTTHHSPLTTHHSPPNT